ncbi:hypothetical protein FIA58_013775 [Flavobacterium jejuense]|uniref:Uncharacterized protein n=1 Tax=Flavobacterium jejuense TaxID=1544455 RepID=A0ABX0IV97_9FLAO|nr:hypothetical protein [Flavobacterium jejuense]NHN26749.1 hypothetical protein [Flavobacterium jejuense]
MPTFLRKSKHIALLSSFVTPLQNVHDELLYQMQHDGRTIYLEKVLNDHFEVVGYSHQNHEMTKTIYIEDVAEPDKLYIYQDEEIEDTFIEDEPDSEDDLFLDADGENTTAFSYVIFIPDTYIFSEPKIRALIDIYRYIGKKYQIQTYTL